MKNAYTSDADYLYVVVPIITSGHTQCSTVFTASRQDTELLAPHRWRVVNGDVVTLMGTAVVPLTKVLLNIPRGTVPHQRDGNKMNYSRRNLRLGANVKENEVLVNGDYAYITLPDTQLVIIDSIDAERVSRFFWKSFTIRGEQVVRTHYKEGNGWKKMELGRFITGYHGRKSIEYLDGDHLNCRRTNLYTGPISTES